MADESLAQWRGCVRGLLHSRPIGRNGARAGYADEPESGKADSK
jgi:hypothetical protein